MEFKKGIQMSDNVSESVPVVVKPIPREISETELAKRAMQRRYKAMYGYKPVGLSLADLAAIVRRAERAHGIVPPEEAPATSDTIADFAAKFRK